MRTNGCKVLTRSLQSIITLGWIMPVKGKPKPLGHSTERVHRITERCHLAGLKPDTLANQGSVRQNLKATAGDGVVHSVLPPKGPERRYKRTRTRSLWLDSDVERRPLVISPSGRGAHFDYNRVDNCSSRERISTTIA